jgi:hypothetical protein
MLYASLTRSPILSSSALADDDESSVRDLERERVEPEFVLLVLERDLARVVDVLLGIFGNGWY